MKKTFCVISHTHWDREWYQSFEKFRMRLCDLINNLFDILDNYPDYIFHLDAQTIVLEDYLQVYPENEKKLKDYIKSGNIVVGPWYVQNDFYLSSGEATVRNLLIGSEIAEKFGKCAKVGYTPDQFGLCSQLPQIFNKFDIKYHLFGRGYIPYKLTENGAERMNPDINFFWQSPDGSRVCSTLMPAWYNNAQRITPDIDKAIERINITEEEFSKRTNSPYFFLMNGVDHLEAQDDLLPILEKINSQFDENREIAQYNMEDALKANEPYIKDVVEGELRYGPENSILAGTFSTRVELKKINFETQNMIEHQIEPLYSMISLLGADIYPENQIRFMWKSLIPNHAHDSICCCSTPNVMKHMTDRYLSINEIGEELLLRGKRFINHHITRNVSGDGVYYLTVINTNQTTYSGVMECEIDIKLEDANKGFKIFAPDGKEIPYTIMDKEATVFTTISPLNLPGNIDVMTYKIQFLAEDIPGFGYVNYTVKTGYDYTESPNGELLENEYIKIDIDRDKINLLDKTNNKVYNDILTFEDIGDKGESYVFGSFEGDCPIKAVLNRIEEKYCNPFKSAVKLYYTIDVPEAKNEESRCGKIVQNKLEVTLSLGQNDRAVTMDVKIENNSKYHLTKAVINTGIDNTVSYASSVYDIIERNSKDIIKEIRTCCSQPVNGFVYKKTDENGIAVFTKGLYEYDNEYNSLIKLSLLRSTDMISFGYGSNTAKAWAVEDNLMLGTTEVSFAIMPFDGDAKNIPAIEQNINAQPLYMFDSTDIHMFSGGRPAVQDTEIPELYFPKDKYENLNLPHEGQLMEINKGVCVTALKKAEKSKDIVLRVYNPTDTEITDIVSMKTNKELSKTNLAESLVLVYDNKIAEKEIQTLIIK